METAALRNEACVGKCGSETIALEKYSWVLKTPDPAADLHLLTEADRSPLPYPTPSCQNRNRISCARSSICFDAGNPPECPARVS